MGCAEIPALYLLRCEQNNHISRHDSTEGYSHLLQQAKWFFFSPGTQKENNGRKENTKIDSRLEQIENTGALSLFLFCFFLLWRFFITSCHPNTERF